MERLGAHTGGSFDARVVAAICLVSITVIFLATRIRKLPLSAGLVLAAGGITYPLYLLHMQMGYTILTAPASVRNVELWTGAIVSGAVVLAWATWRFVERPAHLWAKDGITTYATKLAWRSSTKALGHTEVRAA